MICIGNVEFKTAKSAGYSGNAGYETQSIDQVAHEIEREFDMALHGLSNDRAINLSVDTDLVDVSEFSKMESMSMDHEPEGRTAEDAFYDRLQGAASFAHNFLKKIEEYASYDYLYNKVSIELHYKRIPDLRLRVHWHSNGKNKQQNFIVIQWQPNKERFVVHSILSIHDAPFSEKFGSNLAPLMHSTMQSVLYVDQTIATTCWDEIREWFDASHRSLTNP
jgi:hypothetical protein